MKARPFLIAGHPRSGTTILNRVCNTHSEVMSTFEFRTFLHLDRPYVEYRKGLRLGWNQPHSPLLGVGEASPRMRRWRSRWFQARYLHALNSRRGSDIGLVHVTEVLSRVFGTRLVGDKFPAYVSSLDGLAARQNLYCVVILRDCRAVVASTLKRVRDDWRTEEWSKDIDTTRKVADSWLKCVERLEENAERIHALRFEDLVQEPGETIKGVADFLGVNPSGFDTTIIKNPGKEKFRQSLDAENLEIIRSVAGEAMQRWGYDI